jgi:hypothetical protein
VAPICPLPPYKNLKTVQFFLETYKKRGIQNVIDEYLFLFTNLSDSILKIYI